MYTRLCKKSLSVKIHFQEDKVNIRMVLVLMLMTSVAMFGSETSTQPVRSVVSANSGSIQLPHAGLGSVCYPGDPCGPQPGTVQADVISFSGPMCVPGDPCGPQPGAVQSNNISHFGPVCYPGDPCGPQPGTVQADVISFSGPTCVPGDPCGPQPGTVQADVISFSGPMCVPGDPCGPQPQTLISPASLELEFVRETIAC
jgi:hypothetical protein